MLVKQNKIPTWRRVLQQILVLLGAGVLTVVFFLVLPLIQSIGKGGAAKDEPVLVDVPDLPPPPPPPEEEVEEEEEEEKEEPKLEEQNQLLNIDQLDLVLGDGLGGGFGNGEFAIDLGALGGIGQDTEEMFDLGDLDEEPRPVYQPSPTLGANLRGKGGATVHVVFTVDQNGRVVNPKVFKSSNALYDRTAVQAVKRWRFEPGKKRGKPVPFRMRCPIVFPDV